MPSWSSRAEEDRQRDHSRANKRAKTMRKAPMPSEARLWKALRALNKEGARFRRQAAVGRLVYDFGDFSACLLIELDGGVHQRLPHVALRDEEKTAWAEANGYRLMRITNDQVWGSLDATIVAIRAAISAPHPLPPPHKGEGES